MSVFFGTDGIRGVALSDITFDIAFKCGNSISQSLEKGSKVVVAKDDDTMKLLSRAILDKDEKQIARQLNIVMSRMISILDTKAPDDMKENFYSMVHVDLVYIIIQMGLYMKENGEAMHRRI